MELGLFNVQKGLYIFARMRTLQEQTPLFCMLWQHRQQLSVQSGVMACCVRCRYEYTGYEAGHVPQCQYNSDEHQASYGLSA
jgi:hypothetical protein